MTEKKYEIYQNFITENLFDFFWNGDQKVYLLLDNVLHDENDINKTLHKYFSKEIFYQTQEKMMADGLNFNPLKQDYFFEKLLLQVIEDYKKDKINSI